MAIITAFSKEQPEIVASRRWLFVRFLVATILFVAAGMKAYQLGTTPTLGEGILHARWFNIFVVEFELFFGLWLIFGVLPKLTWLTTVGCFSLFATVSFYKAVSGEASCGCFGTATVNPWITAIVDVFLIALLLAFRPKEITIKLKEFLNEGMKLRQYGRSILTITLLWLFIATPVTYAMISVEERSNVELGTEFIGADGQKTILLEPEKWIGKKLPLFPYFETSPKVEKYHDGQWIILLFHHECSKCEQIKSKLLKSGRKNIAFVELPPYGKNDLGVGQEHIKLSEKISWFAETPIVLIVKNSIVGRITENIDNFE